MPGTRKRTKSQREEDLVRMAEMHAQEIQDDLGATPRPKSIITIHFCQVLLSLLLFCPMPGHKRTKAQRTAQLARIAEMHAMEIPQAEMAKALGLTQPQICHDLKAIYQIWGTADRAALMAQRERMLLKCRLHERAARAAWERSQLSREITTQKQVKTPGEVTGEGDEAKSGPDRERQEASLRTEGRDGNPSFLREIAWCMEQECKLRGLYSPEQPEHQPRDRYASFT
jgi:hypothetical protein